MHAILLSMRPHATQAEFRIATESSHMDAVANATYPPEARCRALHGPCLDCAVTRVIARSRLLGKSCCGHEWQRCTTERSSEDCCPSTRRPPSSRKGAMRCAMLQPLPLANRRHVDDAAPAVINDSFPAVSKRNPGDRP